MGKLPNSLKYTTLIILYTLIVQISSIHGCQRGQPQNRPCNDYECSQGTCVQIYGMTIRTDSCMRYEHDELRRKRSPEDGFIYRILRDNELQQYINDQRGLIARDPGGHRSVQSHVGCGSRSGYQSQYISCTASHQAALDWARLARERRNAGALAVVKISRFWLQAMGCTIVDLTDAAVRNSELTHPISRNCAARYDEVLVVDHIPYGAIQELWIVDENGTEISYYEWQRRNPNM